MLATLPCSQALNQSFDSGSTITLQQFIIIFGCIQLVLSQVSRPTLLNVQPPPVPGEEVRTPRVLFPCKGPKCGSLPLQRRQPCLLPLAHRRYLSCRFLPWFPIFLRPVVPPPQFPTIHDLRLLNMICTICTMAFGISATALSIYSGVGPSCALHASHSLLLSIFLPIYLSFELTFFLSARQSAVRARCTASVPAACPVPLRLQPPSHKRSLRYRCPHTPTTPAPPSPAGYNPPEDAEPVSYAVVGSTATKVFGVFSALGTIAFGFGDTILPEIQARPQRLSVAAAALRMRAAAAVPQVLFVPFLIKHAKQEPHVVGAHVPQPSSRPPPRQQGPPCPACTRGVPEPPTRGPRLLPVVQATLKEPVKWNMYKAVALCYSVISISYIIVTVAGYWVSRRLCRRAWPWTCKRDHQGLQAPDARPARSRLLKRPGASGVCARVCVCVGGGGGGERR
jgi:hypothetical protein